MRRHGAIGLVGIAVVVGCGGTTVKTVTEKAEPSFREKARDALAEEWGDRYRACLTDDDYWGGDLPVGNKHRYPGYPKVDAYMKRTCRKKANEILP
jgi:hypothetical protein